MLSIIICSRNPAFNELLSTNIKATVGVDYELIYINNSENRYSIYSAYNEGISKSKFPFLCFVHDDIQFNTQNWGEKIIKHLNNPTIGLAGLAGGDAMLRVPFDYGALNRCMNIIHVDKTGDKPTEYIRMPTDFKNNSRPVVLLDGVLICGRRLLFEKIRFDESFGGFHGYDYDISIQSFIAGYTNIVMYDIELEHFSKGKMDVNYFRTLKKVFEKWEKHLPVFERNISKEEQNQLLKQLEKKRISRLLKWLVRSGMSINEIAEYISIFVRKTGTNWDVYVLKLLRIRILFIRIISTLRNKNNY